MDGGLRTIESVAYTPKRILEGFKGFSEAKAAKMLAEGKYFCFCDEFGLYIAC